VSQPPSNLVVIRGVRTAPPRPRVEPSVDVLHHLEVTTTLGDGSRTSVPVAAPAVSRLARGAEVVVVGAVRRRIFRAGGSTASRTEVVADRVVPATRSSQVASALGRGAASLMAAAGPTGSPGPPFGRSGSEG
jgi:hypothetical protein